MAGLLQSHGRGGNLRRWRPAASTGDWNHCTDQHAVFCQGPYDKSRRYRDFMGWDMPWYSAQASLEKLVVGRQIGLFHLVCYVRDGDRVFETYWTTRRGVEAMDYSYALMDLTPFGRQEKWEDSPPGWPQQYTYTRTGSGSPTWQPEWPGGRPIAQWSRLEAGRSDNLGTRHGQYLKQHKVDSCH